MEYVSLKRCVLRRDLKVERVSELRMSGGRVFQRWGGRSAEGSGPHGNQACGRHSEWNGRGGPESAGGCVGV